jgi:purine-nucleoside/S-methyl-5'-thioadenosine phosphorylase / adenosine deaminase
MKKINILLYERVYLMSDNNLLFHNEPSFHIFFGNQRTSFLIEQEQFFATHTTTTLQAIEPFATIASCMRTKKMTLLHQIHSSLGACITNDTHPVATTPYAQEGDFLITNQPNLGIGIKSADCLPLIFFDSLTSTVAIAHAGWKGSVQEIALKTVEALVQQGASLATIKIFFGPSAKICCYRVGPEFESIITPFSYGSQTVQKRGQNLFFDLPLFNQLQLIARGISPSSFIVDYNLCTICSPSYCSARYQDNQTRRQITMVSLKDEAPGLTSEKF